MESHKKQDERAIGERFIEWFNAQFGLSYTLKCAREAPDLVYELPDKTELFIEVTSAYYGKEYAKFIWDGIRSSENQIISQVSEVRDEDSELVSDIVRIVSQKCSKRYEKHCILVVGVTSFWIPAQTLAKLLLQCEFPDNNFAVHGRFPSSDLRPGENNYTIIPLKPYSNTCTKNRTYQ